jgi:HNH endonuclease
MTARESGPPGRGPLRASTTRTTRATVPDADALTLDVDGVSLVVGGQLVDQAVEVTRPRRPRVPIEPDELTESMLRFWRFVELPAAPDRCAHWMGARDRWGYGQFRLSSGRLVLAHRVAVVWSTGQPIPTDLEVDHLCRVRLCVAPAHLDVVPGRVNVARGESVSAATMRAYDERGECARGHDLTVPGAWCVWWGDGHRRCCRACRDDRARERYNALRYPHQETRLFDLSASGAVS